MAIDIKQRLTTFRNNEPGTVVISGPVLDALCRDALAEIERFEHDLEVAKDLVRVLAPTVNTMTRHTITLAQAIPELKPGDSLVLQILPNR